MEPIPKFASADEIFTKAGETSNSVPETLRYSIFLYYLSRYFVAVFEARFGRLPLQVWNEYRNTLDHFFRHVTKADQGKVFVDSSGHLQKMEGHAQRAVLDICKISCLFNQRHLDDLIIEHGRDVLELVDNGTFYSDLLAKRQHAILAFERAKIADSGLGSDNAANKDVVHTYVQAVFNFQILIASFDDRADAILRCRERVVSLKHHSGLRKLFSEVAVHLISAAIGFLIALALPPSFKKAVADLMSGLHPLF